MSIKRFKTNILIVLLVGICIICITSIDVGAVDNVWTDSEIILIKENAGSYATSYDFCLDSEGTIHAIYKNSVSGDGVYYLNKTRCGDWSQHEPILEGGFEHQMYIDAEDTIHLIWYESENVVEENLVLYWMKNYYYCYKQTNAEWSDPELFFTGYYAGGVWGESFIVDNEGIAHVVISCDDNQEPINNNPDFDYYGLCYFYRSTNGQWSDTELLTSLTSGMIGASLGPILSIDAEGTIHLAYTNNYDEIYYQYKSLGNSWSNKELIPESFIYSAGEPYITTDSSNYIHLVWTAYNYELYGVDDEVFYSYKSPSGSWSSPNILTPDSNNHAYEPILKIDGNGNMHLLWTEIYSDYSTEDIFYKYKPMGGSWTDNEIICNRRSQRPHGTSMEVDPEGDIYVGWEESGDLFHRNTWTNNPPSASMYTETIVDRYTEAKYLFNGIATDYEKCDSIFYWIDWGDGTNSGWLGPYNYGEEFESYHSWSSLGNYSVKVKAKDIRDTESGWSEEIIITTSQKTPGFELILAICAIALVFFWKRKRMD